MVTNPVRLSAGGFAALEIVVRPVCSAALLHAGFPFLLDCRRRGEGAPTLKGRLSLEPLRAGWSIETDGTAWRATPDPELRSGLEAVTGAQRANVKLSVADHEATAEICLHDAWYWPLLPDVVALLAAFVLPQDAVVSRLAWAMRAWPEKQPLQGIYEVLRTRWSLHWAPPSVVRTHDGTCLQELRPPWRVMSQEQRSSGEGSCIDLSLLVAGALEAVGQGPVVVLSLDSEGVPYHAVVGAWKVAGRRFRPVLRGDEVRHAVETQALDVVDITRACRDRARPLQKARSEARELVAGAADILAIDVTAARPPHGRIAPLEAAWDGHVAAAVVAAEEIAIEMGAPAIETLHLFRGMCGTPGPLAGTLLAAAGLTTQQVMEWTRETVPGPAPQEKPQRTRGFERCLADARSLARAQGSSIVRESDLWWAVLPSKSASLERVFRRRPEARAALLAALAEVCPSSSPESGSGSA